MNKYHFILPLLSFILFLGTYIAALDEASRPKSSVATVFRPGFSRIGLSFLTTRFDFHYWYERLVEAASKLGKEWK